MKFYIMYEQVGDYELAVVEYSSPVDTVVFIENKIENQGHHLDDFKVIQGRELSLHSVTTPIKVLLGN